MRRKTIIRDDFEVAYSVRPSGGLLELYTRPRPIDKTFTSPADSWRGLNRRLLQKDPQLRLGVSPPAGEPLRAAFDLDGLVDAIAPLRAACGWE